MGTPTEIADGIWQWVAAPKINVWAIRDADEWTVIDTSISRNKRVISGLKSLGVTPGSVRRILLTHCHPDHTGGIRNVREAFGADVEVYAGTDDVPYLHDGSQPDSDPATRMGRRVNRITRRGPRIPDAAALPESGFDIGGGCAPFATPGHSPGHTAYHFPRHGLVVGGDVVFNFFKLSRAFSGFCSSLTASDASIAAVADIEPATLALSHGAAIDDDPAGRLRELLTKPNKAVA